MTLHGQLPRGHRTHVSCAGGLIRTGSGGEWAGGRATRQQRGRLAWGWVPHRWAGSGASRLGPSSTGGGGKVPPPEVLAGPKPTCPSAFPASAAKALTCCQPAATLPYTAQPSTGKLPTLGQAISHSSSHFPALVAQQGLAPSWHPVNLCWLED